MKLPLRSKLLIIVVVPTLLCTLIAIIISSLSIKSDGVQALTEKSTAIISRLEATREYIAQQGMLDYSIEEALKSAKNNQVSSSNYDKIMKQVPIFSSIKVGEKNAAQENYEFRVTSIGARNPKNEASDIEARYIKKFESGELSGTEVWENKEENKLWVMRPIYLSESQGCLTCHGNPNTSPWGNGKDILGFDMENWKDGTFKGLFIIKSDLAPVQESAQASIFKITGISLLISVLAIIISIIVIRMITTAIKKIIEANKKISEGNLDVEVSINTKDELEELGNYTNEMVERLRDVINNIREVAASVSNASRDISSASSQLSMGASTQASSVEQVSASMEEMTSNIDQNTDNAQETKRIAMESNESVKKGNQSSKIAMESMNNIAQKITIINEIAFQTNILALNAAVEAARAGAHGAGFAVVASEVRKLAEKSKIAAEEIESLSKNGVEISLAASKMLEDVVPQIEKTTMLIQEISTSSLEQSSGSNQINEAIQSLNDVTQQNAASAEELASTASEFNTLATSLEEAVSFFKSKK